MTSEEIKLLIQNTTHKEKPRTQMASLPNSNNI